MVGIGVLGLWERLVEGPRKVQTEFSWTPRYHETARQKLGPRPGSSFLEIPLVQDVGMCYETILFGIKGTYWFSVENLFCVSNLLPVHFTVHVGSLLQ